MKKLTRGQVVPIISASVSWLTFAMIGSGWRLLKSVNVGPFNVLVMRIGNQSQPHDANCRNNRQTDEQANGWRRDLAERLLCVGHDIKLNFTRSGYEECNTTIFRSTRIDVGVCLDGNLRER